jgi:hypothetical protein
MERARSFTPFAKVRKAIFDIRTQSDSTAHPGSSLTAATSLSKPFQVSEASRLTPFFH